MLSQNAIEHLHHKPLRLLNQLTLLLSKRPDGEPLPQKMGGTKDSDRKHQRMDGTHCGNSWMAPTKNLDGWVALIELIEKVGMCVVLCFQPGYALRTRPKPLILSVSAPYKPPWRPSHASAF